ncbi:MFS transporter [Kineosporia mesophila]|uniref:MFS transporter n=1 Tax=Kineosporia mesophila TaxID=566012 RepID=A0ABP6Z985_9ACTN|nr:MFS transporter [Kineosporia mesophila]MCD5352040.1 MFS transporter [Kineosporia mesophila]
MKTQTIDRAALARWRNAIFAAFAVGGLALSTWGPRLPALRADLDLDTGGIGVLLAGITVGSVVGLLSSTPLLTRFGARRAVPGAMLVIAAAVTIIGVGSTVLHSVPVVAVGFVVAGFAIGTLDVMINVDGAGIERAAGRTLMPLMHAAWSAGAAVGAGIGAGCAALGINPATQFTAEAFLMAALALFAATAIPGGPREEQTGTAAELSRGERFRVWLRGWADWRLLTIGLVMLGAELGEGSANNWLTLAASDGHGQSPSIAALFFTAFAIGETTARVLGGPVVDRLGRVRTVQITSLLGVLGVVLFILAGHPVVMLVAVLLWAIGVSMGFPLGMSAAADSGPNPAARVSIVATLGYFANLAGPPAVGFLAQITSLLTAFWLLALFFLIAALAAGALRPRTTTR